MALRITAEKFLSAKPIFGLLGVALTVGEKGVGLIEGETAASHLTPLHAPGHER